MTPKLLCPKCGSDRIDVNYSIPLSYRCCACGIGLVDLNDPGIPVISERDAKLKRPGMYGETVCTCCTHAPHPPGECPYCNETKREVRLAVLPEGVTAAKFNLRTWIEAGMPVYRPYIPLQVTNMSDLRLTQAERDKFVLWLKQEAAVENGLAEQMDKLGPVTAPGAKLYRMKAAARLLVAKDLESIQEQVL